MRFFLTGLILFFCEMVVAQQRVPGEVIIQLNHGVFPRQISLDLPEGKIRLLSKSWNIWLFNSLHGDEEQMLRAVQKIPEVKIAQYNHRISKRVLVPNDTQFVSQWALENTGQSTGTPDADIDAPEAWELTTSGISSAGDTIVIAMVDDGFDLQHEDLRFWKNRNDLHNGIDDDFNGYIDDYDGWDVDTHSDSIPIDFHGTQIAGVAAAKGNNSIGISGVAWNVRILPVSLSEYTEAQVVEAYSYIFDVRKNYNITGGAEGAFVVAANSSFGIDFGNPQDYPLWCALYDSWGSIGVLSVASTMNITTDVDIVGDMPTSCASDYLITVTNTTRFDSKNATAAIGYTTVDLGAPGTSILSTIPGNGYVNATGTSMSAPHVTGAIAALYGLSCPSLDSLMHTDPAGYALRMKRYILSGTDILDVLDGLTVTGGRLNLYNSTLIYFNECISCLGMDVEQTMVSCHDSANGIISIQATDGVTPYTFEWSTGDTTSALSGLERGKYWVTVTDANSCEKSGYFEITEPLELEVNVVSDSSTNGTNGSVAAYVNGGTSPYSYQWNDALNSTTAAVSDLSPGEYTVTVTDANGCQAIHSVIVKGFGVGLDPVSGNSVEFMLSPNPVETIAWVEVSATFQSPVHLSVFDLSGKLLLEKEISGKKTPIDLLHFPPETTS